MEQEVLKKLRKSLSDKQITLTRLSEVSDIPITTLVEMRKPEYGKRHFDRMDALKSALDELLPEHEGAK